MQEAATEVRFPHEIKIDRDFPSALFLLDFNEPHRLTPICE